MVRFRLSMSLRARQRTAEPAPFAEHPAADHVSPRAMSRARKCNVHGNFLMCGAFWTESMRHGRLPCGETGEADVPWTRGLGPSARRAIRPARRATCYAGAVRGHLLMVQERTHECATPAVGIRWVGCTGRYGSDSAPCCTSHERCSPLLLALQAWWSLPDLWSSASTLTPTPT